MTVAPTARPLCPSISRRGVGTRSATRFQTTRIFARHRARAEQMLYQRLKRQRFSSQRVWPSTHSLMPQNGVSAHSLTRNQAVIGGASGHISQSRDRKNRRHTTARSVPGVCRNLVDRRGFRAARSMQATGQQYSDLGPHRVRGPDPWPRRAFGGNIGWSQRTKANPWFEDAAKSAEIGNFPSPNALPARNTVRDDFGQGGGRASLEDLPC
jgi:hypothetical protein